MTLQVSPTEAPKEVATVTLQVSPTEAPKEVDTVTLETALVIEKDPCLSKIATMVDIIFTFMCY